MNEKDLRLIDSLVNAPLSSKILSKDMGRHIESACISGSDPLCQVKCPISLDVIAFITKLQKGNFNSAYTILREHSMFPEIVCALCPAPCKDGCIRKDVDHPVDMKKLERAAIDYARSTAPVKYNIPKKDQRAAIVGAGICGLSAAVKLVSHGYDVSLFEKSGRIGGLLWDVLSPDIFLTEIENQMQFLEYELLLNTEVKSLDDLAAFDAVLIATGECGDSFGLLDSLNEKSLGSVKEGFFVAGGILDADIVNSIEQGMRVAQSIENYLKVNRMHEMMGIRSSVASGYIQDLNKIEKKEHVQAERYTKEEAAEEAARCLKCDCSDCFDNCDFMQFYKKLPKKIAGEVRTSFNPVEGLQARIATRLINSCSACGLCEDVCPVDINMGDFLIEARRLMHSEKTLPAAWHDFWVRDMFFANSERCDIVKNAAGFESSKYVFFPGCQLGASDPYYVREAYSYLRRLAPDTGLILKCCGVPAEWAGDDVYMAENMKYLREEWERMGCPKFIFACPTCEKMFRSYLPEIEQISIYDIIAEHGLPETGKNGVKTLAVYDPCSSRYDVDMQDSVRRIVQAAGHTVEELNFGKDSARCCGYGGHIYPANAALAGQISGSRVKMSEHPYVTYCANCRDIFSVQGKDVLHILDIVFGRDAGSRKAPSLTERRRNRMVLKKDLLADVWQEECASGKAQSFNIQIVPGLTEKLDRLLIVEDDISEVIRHCEETGDKIIDEETGITIGHLQQGVVTYWVCYKNNGDGSSYEVVNAYCHRMQISDDIVE